MQTLFIKPTFQCRFNNYTCNSGITIDGITWWIQCYPCGKTKEESEYHVCFHIDENLSEVETTCGINVGGVLLQKSNRQDSVSSDIIEFQKALLHNLGERVDHKNRVVDLLCRIQFSKPAQQLPQEPSKHAFKDQGSDKHQWQVLYFPAGDLPRSKGHFSLFIKVYTSETKQVTVSYAIKNVGTTFEENDVIVVEKKSNFRILKLISHKELQRISGVINNKVTIVCTATFDTQ